MVVNIPEQCILCNTGRYEQQEDQVLLLRYDPTQASVDLDHGVPMRCLRCNLCGHVVFLSDVLAISHPGS